MNFDPSGFYQTLEHELQLSTGDEAKIVSSDPVGGGCINSTEIISLNNGQRYFVKSNRVHDLFQAESLGLKEIKTTDSIRAPEVIAVGTSAAGTDKATNFLILEAIESGIRSKTFFETFGRSLALMHKFHAANITNEQHLQGFGYSTNNHIGSTPQVNTWSTDWIEFFATQRIGFQIKMASQNGLSNKALTQGCDALIGKLDSLLGNVAEPPALIHGDLWSGNFMVSAQGEPVLIDPAVYFALRESEFGMTKLFGGFNDRFYSAYNEAYLLADGWEDRAEIYKLYHLLNHLNLFGTSYLAPCLEIIRKFT